MSTVVTDDEAKRNIAANVARLLALRGWTQKQLADATGETNMIISRIMREKHVPNAATLARIAEALDTSTDILLDPPPKEKSRQTA